MPPAAIPVRIGARLIGSNRTRRSSRACSTPPPTRAGWATPLPPGVLRGIALNEAYNTFCRRGRRSRRSTTTARCACTASSSALDPGTVVNPLTVEMQTESAVVFGLTAALYGEITIKDGRVEQSNFHDYRMLRLAEMPQGRDRLCRAAASGAAAANRRLPSLAPALVQCDFRGDRQAHPLAAA